MNLLIRTNVPTKHFPRKKALVSSVSAQLIPMSSTSGVAGPPKPPPRFAKQELAPATGYPEINVARNVPRAVGKNASLYLIGGAAIMAYGFYRVGTFNVKRR